MSSTKLSISNNSTVPITATLYFGWTKIGSVEINPGQSGSIPCEYVWYDLKIKNNNDDKDILTKNGVYGHSSWNFTGNPKEGYKISKTS